MSIKTTYMYELFRFCRFIVVFNVLFGNHIKIYLFVIFSTILILIFDKLTILLVVVFVIVKNCLKMFTLHETLI